MNTIGASELAVAMGWQRAHEDGEVYTSELELWARCCGLVERYDAAESPDSIAGQVAEPGIGHRYAELHGLKWGTDIMPGPALAYPPLTHEGIPWLHARPDFLVLSGRRFVEAKAPREIGEEWGEEGTDQIPRWCLVQVIAQMAIGYLCFGVERCDVAVFARAASGRHARVFVVYTVHRDPQVEASILSRGAAWYHEHVELGVMPAPDGSDSAGRTLGLLWPSIDSAPMAATPELVELCHRLRQVQAARRIREAHESSLVQELQAAMREHTELLGPDGRRLATWRTGQDGRRRFRLARENHNEGDNDGR